MPKRSPLALAKTHQVRAKGTRVAVHEMGEGPPLVLVHGLGSSALSFSRMLPALARTNRVLAVDLPGFGESDKPFQRFSLRELGELVLGAIAQLGAANAGWIGHSMGAQIGLVTSLAHPDRVRSLALLSPAGLERFSRMERWILESTITRRWVRDQSPAQLRKALDLAFYDTPPEASWLLDRRLALEGEELAGFAYAFAGGVRAMLDTPTSRQLTHVKARTLVAFGESDRLVPNRMMHPTLSPRRLLSSAKRRVHECETVLVPRAGHLLPFERPDEVASMLQRFFLAGRH
ncbi:MAG: alpha/beta fold hydrolase [Myxococcota bacterium]